MRKALSALLALAIAALTVCTFAVPNAVGFPDPSLARIIFWHLPCALLCSLYVFIGAYYGARYLSEREWHLEVKAAAATNLAWILSLLTMATGILFSKVQWGAWWHWDPRQTSFLLVLLILAGYEVLRVSIADDEVRAKSSAAYIAAAALPCMFLIFVFPRMPRFFSLHPQTTIVRGELDPTYGSLLWSMVGVFFVLSLLIFRLRVKATLIEHALVIENDAMDDRGHSAATGVVRPVSVPTED